MIGFTLFDIVILSIFFIMFIIILSIDKPIQVAFNWPYSEISTFGPLDSNYSANRRHTKKSAIVHTRQQKSLPERWIRFGPVLCDP